MLDKLERRLGRFAIPNLVTFLVAGQVGSWILGKTPKGEAFIAALELDIPRVLSGELWRLLSFLFIAPSGGWFGDLFLIFYFLLIFIYGRALEGHWGAFRFNAYMFIGWFATVATAFLVGKGTNLFLMESLLFAFAYLYPDFELRLFFILPVKIKWIALLVGAQLLYAMYQFVAFGLAPMALLPVAGVLNFVVFFASDMRLRLRGRARRAQRRREVARTTGEPTHRCAVCGTTDLDDPTAQFRYCSQCDGKRGYCMDHIRDHEHVR